MDFDAIFIVGFIILGIYKLFELFVKRKERLTIIEKLPFIIETYDADKKINLPKFSLGINDYYSFWALRISLLLIGVGLGCIFSLLMQMQDTVIDFLEKARDLGYSRSNINGLLNFAWVCFMGGLGLFIAYLIELKNLKKKN